MDKTLIYKSHYKTSPIVCTLQLFFTGIISVLYYEHITWWLVILSFLLLFWVGHGIGQHRYLSHNSFALNKFWHIVVIYLATIVTFGSALGWAMLHKAHHRYSDTDKDTYFTKNPFKILICVTNPANVSFKDGKISKDQFVQFTHKYYNVIILLNNVVLYLISIKIWLAFNIAVVLCYFAFIWTWAIAHNKTLFSYKNFPNSTAYNDIICGYLLSEWHNNHHAKPNSISQRVKFWEIDPISYIIKAIKKHE